MSEKKMKALRGYLRSRGISISAEPYERLPNRMVLASINRQRYQLAKKELR